MKIAVLHEPLAQKDLKDWGAPEQMFDGNSHTQGVLLHKGEGGASECGYWECTPGHWRCEVTRDEFCHFLEGEARYESDDGEVTDIRPDTAAFFPAGWSGSCRVTKTLKKVYMIR
ncbi:MAG: cupin [Acidiferrobacter sp.]|nr:cupin [Acidiferrobacter sp.]